MGLGLICTFRVSEADRSVESTRQALVALAHNGPEGVEPPPGDTYRPSQAYHAIQDELQRHRVDASNWRRRRMGLVLAGLVLLAGGFVASGIRALHERMSWAIVEGEETDHGVSH